MNSLYLITENITNGYRAEFLDILTLIAILCGILVIVSKNPIISVCAPFWISFALKLNSITYLQNIRSYCRIMSNKVKLIIILRI